jgi:hypothetical protein
VAHWRNCRRHYRPKSGGASEEEKEELKNLRRYIANEGKFGSVTETYALIQAAKYLGVPPWVLAEQPKFWQDKAHLYMTAEHQADKLIAARNKPKGGK